MNCVLFVTCAYKYMCGSIKV